jgi:hypothetical protein
MAGDNFGRHCPWWNDEQVPIRISVGNRKDCSWTCSPAHLSALIPIFAAYASNVEAALQCMYYVLCNQPDIMSLFYVPRPWLGT